MMMLKDRLFPSEDTTRPNGLSVAEWLDETTVRNLRQVKQEFILANRGGGEKEVPLLSALGIIHKGSMSGIRVNSDMVQEISERTLIFVGVDREANRLGLELVRQGCRAMSIGRDTTLALRHSIISKFNAGHLPVLVCSGVEPRLLGANGVGHVINYDLPRKKMDLDLHFLRIEDAARQGSLKRVTSLFDKYDDKCNIDHYARILYELGQPVPRFFDPYFREFERDALGRVKPLVTKEEEDAAAGDDDSAERYEF